MSQYIMVDQMEVLPELTVSEVIAAVTAHTRNRDVRFVFVTQMGQIMLFAVDAEGQAVLVVHDIGAYFHVPDVVIYPFSKKDAAILDEHEKSSGCDVPPAPPATLPENVRDGVPYDFVLELVKIILRPPY